MAKNESIAQFTVPGLSLKAGQQLASTLQGRLFALNHLQLTLKHAHGNVVGRDFMGVHEMLDPQIELVRDMIDEMSERIATLGVSPIGLPGELVRERELDDYPVGRAATTEHLSALDAVYNGIVSSHREAIKKIGELDPVTEDMLIGQSAKLELFQWFMRAHLENSSGELPPGDGAAATPKKSAVPKTKT